MYTFQAVYLSSLNSAWDIEDQIITALPKCIGFAHNASLKKALTQHLEETHTHKQRIGELLSHHNYTLQYQRDMTFLTLLQDIFSDIHLLDDKYTKDAFIIGACLTIKHVEIARYKNLCMWASKLEDDLGVVTIKKNLGEEELAINALSILFDTLNREQYD